MLLGDILKSPINTLILLLIVIPDLLLNVRNISPSNRVLFFLFGVFILILKSNAVFGLIVILRPEVLFFSFWYL